MEAYLLKASAILGIFLLTYQLLLRKETFFRLNRFFLLTGIGAALILPLITIKEEIAIPLELLQSGANTEPGFASQKAGPEWDALLQAGYLLGALFLTGMVGKQIISLLGLMRNPNKECKDGVVLVPTDRVQSPFSFFRYIFYNPQAHNKDELQQVLEHEKAHARQLHSLDVLLGRVTAIMLWINPLAWWYQRSIQQNLEYLADAHAVQKLASVKAYQYTLLKVSGNTLTPSLVNSFNSPLIKKRIVMLHQNQSKTIHLVKYLLILPVIAAFLMAFNRETVYIPEAADTENVFFADAKTIEVTIDKATTDEELLELKKKLAKDGVDFSYTTVRNEAREIINLSFNISGKAENGNPFSGSYNSDSDEPIKPVLIYINSEGGVFFGEASTFKEFSNGKELHFRSDSGHKTVWVQKTGSNGGKTIEIRRVNGNDSFILDGEEVTQEEMEQEYLQQLGERERKMIRVVREGGSKVIIVDGKEVSHEVSGEEGKAEKIFVKILESDEEADEEVEIREIHVEGGEAGQIIEITSEGNEKARHKTLVIDTDESGDFSHAGKSKIILPQEGDTPLIFIDGKRANKKKMDKLDPEQIESINIWKGDKAVEKYGKKAEDGVIEITTKKQ